MPEICWKSVVRKWSAMRSFFANVGASTGRTASPSVFLIQVHLTRKRCTLVCRASSDFSWQSRTSSFTLFMRAFREGWPWTGGGTQGPSRASWRLVFWQILGFQWPRGRNL